MKSSPELKCSSSEEWLQCVMENFNIFLQDHADCERKASSMAMSFVAKFPDRVEIIPTLIETALEELEHFRDVYMIMEKRGVKLRAEIVPDNYINLLIEHCRSGREERTLDRLLVASIVECRGAERFKMISNALRDEELKKFYHRLWTSEAKHGNIFVLMALKYYPEANVNSRIAFLVEKEAEILRSLPLKPALH